MIPHQTVISRCPIQIEALQQGDGDGEGLLLGIFCHADALTVMPHCPPPAALPKGGIALIQKVAHQLCQEHLQHK